MLGGGDPVAALAPFHGGSVILAVSGGGDSMAMLHAAAEAGLRGTAVTVDHGFRAEAADEARWVKRVAAEMGFAHRTVRVRPDGRSMAAARMARLDGLSRVAGRGTVLLAHTADDQAETVRMRLDRGLGLGLAGIAPATLVGDAWFARPFLPLDREALRLWLRDRSLAWIDDPTNSDPRFERARVRAGMTVGERDRLCAVASRTAEQRRATATRLASDLGGRLERGNDHARVRDWNGVREHRAVLLAALARFVARTPHAPSPAAIVAALAALDRGERFTLGGCLVRVARRTLEIEREPRWRPAPPTLRIAPSHDWPLLRALDPDLPAPPGAVAELVETGSLAPGSIEPTPLGTSRRTPSPSLHKRDGAAYL